MPLVIAIDGPAASGKGTLAKRLADHYGLPHLDTGLLYRAVALALIDAGLPLEDQAAAGQAARDLDAGKLDDPRLRERAMGEAASRISAVPAVRAGLLAWQRRFATDPQGAVLDGRDIGTVVCPEAGGEAVHHRLLGGARPSTPPGTGRPRRGRFASRRSSPTSRRATPATPPAPPHPCAWRTTRCGSTRRISTPMPPSTRRGRSWSAPGATPPERGSGPRVDPPVPLTYCGPAVPDRPLPAARDASA